MWVESGGGKQKVLDFGSAILKERFLRHTLGKKCKRGNSIDPRFIRRENLTVNLHFSSFPPNFQGVKLHLDLTF